MFTTFLSPERDRFLIWFWFRFVTRILTYRTFMSITYIPSYKLNKITSMSKLVPLLFKCSLLLLQLYLEFIFSLFLSNVSLTTCFSQDFIHFDGIVVSIIISRNLQSIIICFALVSQS